ncbi:hypothetical protein B0J18DRAFT_448644 [Chaetomium sp. MPI-SDFR-AT-0129]|nr:hypothetical protein B0J18DRAFT_448644 [Chaetomium sp. MPI-SDFR-AT-0129]
MFYSHEILTSQAYGVATCHYVLSDAERVQSHMRAFYNALGGSENALDPQAGKSKRRELILEDDPEFDLNPDLPAFHFDDGGNLVVPQISQASRKTSSQFSPLDRDGSLSSSNRSMLRGFDLSQSPFGGAVLPGPPRAGTMTPAKENDELMPFGDEERELQALDDWGFEIDADGNIIPAMEEPQLPRLPQQQDEEGAGIVPQDEFLPFGEEGDVVMGGTRNVFHSDPPLPVQQRIEENREQDPEWRPAQHEREAVTENEADASRAAPVQRRRRRPVLAPDDQTKITRHELKAWSTNYLANAEKSQPRHAITAADARKNAYNLVFGRGIAGIGSPTGVPGLPHPLASHFSGPGLHAQLLGIIITDPGGDDIDAPHGRRRSALEALDLEEDDDIRRVRPRLSQDDEDQPLPDDGDLPPIELGRRAGSALPDIPSDVPWNRPSSQIPSSSVKAAGSRPPSRQVSASPLHGRGSLLIPGPEIERFSDDAAAQFPGSDGFDPLIHSALGGSGSAGDLAFAQAAIPQAANTQHAAATTSQEMHTALDREGRNFLDYVATVARDKGAPTSPSSRTNNNNKNDNKNDNTNTNTKQWTVPFEALFEGEDCKKAVVAQAFYHVLSLATKNVLRVRQEGQGGLVPYGRIHLGVDVVDGSLGGGDGDGW